MPDRPDRPLLTTDRARYASIKQCAVKRRFATYQAALQKNSYPYACDHCGGFHRTSRPLDAGAQVKLIERMFGGPITPEKITAFNEWVPPVRVPKRVLDTLDALPQTLNTQNHRTNRK